MKNKLYQRYNKIEKLTKSKLQDKTTINSPQSITTKFIELATIHILFVIKLLIFKHFGYEHNLRDVSCKSTHLMQKIDFVQCHSSNFKLETVLQN